MTRSYNEALLQYIDVKKKDIYFFGVNTTYISSNVMKISVNLRVCSMSEILDSLTLIFLIFTKKKVNFLLFFLSRLTNGKHFCIKLRKLKTIYAHTVKKNRKVLFIYFIIAK